VFFVAGLLLGFFVGKDARLAFDDADAAEDEDNVFDDKESEIWYDAWTEAYRQAFNEQNPILRARIAEAAADAAVRAMHERRYLDRTWTVDDAEGGETLTLRGPQ
jgi:hypothetical protein